ncbi:MAG: hypothetical protein VZQ62_01045 [Methanosphaera sp.]|nr:hypothetical protein [Methanosphaera sp.]
MAAIVGRKGSAQMYMHDGENQTLTIADRLANLVTFEAPNPETTDIDVTDFDSDGKEFEPGTIEYGESTFEQHLTDSEYEDMMTRVQSQDKVTTAYFIVKKDGTTLAVGRKGNAYVKACQLNNIEIDGAFSVTTTLKWTGATSTTTLPSA